MEMRQNEIKVSKGHDTGGKAFAKGLAKAVCVALLWLLLRLVKGLFTVVKLVTWPFRFLLGLLPLVPVFIGGVVLAWIGEQYDNNWLFGIGLGLVILRLAAEVGIGTD